MLAPDGTVHRYDVAFKTGVTEYKTLVWPWQTKARPDIVPATEGNGFTVTAKGEDALPLPQAFVPWTVIVPDEAVEEKSTVILFVLAPDAIVAPKGKLQIYPVALVIEAME
jgi:hypothetical protein